MVEKLESVNLFDIVSKCLKQPIFDMCRYMKIKDIVPIYRDIDWKTIQRIHKEGLKKERELV